MRSANRWLLALSAAIGLLSAGARSGAEEPGDGFRWKPDMGWRSGDHRIDVSLVSRYRFESWDARAGAHDGFHGVRTRLAVRYAHRDTIAIVAEAQHVKLWSLSPNGSGASALYRSNTSGGDDSQTDQLRLRQLYLELAIGDAKLRAGRQDLNLGTTLTYEEPDWRYLKIKRLSQRLVGTVGWTHGERSYDGVSAIASPLLGHSVQLFAAQPTTGVFEIDDGYERQEDITFGGVDWSVERGTWLANTELGAFGIAYADTRDDDDGGLGGDVKVYTLGASLLGVYPIGPGKLDVLAWTAVQWGEFPGAGGRDLDHLAAAGIAEIGYRLPETPTQPWLRLGINLASGDDDPDDGDHRTFFNLLPTNHLYYGYADQLAFQNLADLLIQLRLKPLAKVGLELTWHRFWLLHAADARYFGTGAFSRSAFGFGAAASHGSRDVGHELDVVGTWAVHRNVSLTAGYAYLWGGDVFGPSRRDTEWAFAQVELKY